MTRTNAQPAAPDQMRSVPAWSTTDSLSLSPCKRFWRSVGRMAVAMFVVVGRRGYCDRFVTRWMCRYVWVCMLVSGMGSRQFCRGRRRGRELEAEARQSEIDVVCVILISCTMHIVVTCSCFVVNDIYQWKTLQRSFIKKYIKYQTEPRPRQKLWGRAEADAVRSTETEARPCEAEARPSQLKYCLEAVSSRGRCLEDSVPG